MKKLILIGIATLYCFNSFAFRVEYGSKVIITQPVYEDLYIAGGTVTIEAPVYGDLIIMGGTVNINDSVTHDILVFGGTVVFNGFAGDEIRCVGGKITISKNVAGDVAIAGGYAIIDKNVTIGGLLAMGGDVTLNGLIMGNMKGAFGDVILNGDVMKDIDCRAGSITINSLINGKSILAARYITLGKNASFNNDIRFWNDAGFLDLKPIPHKGIAVYDPALQIDTGEWYYLGAVTLMGFLWYLGAAFLMILILQYLFSTAMKNAANIVFDKSLKTLAVGALFFIAVPIAILICLATIIGVPLAALLLICFITTLLLASIISSIVTANWINNRFDKNWSYMALCFAALGVFILLKLVSLIPFAGWIITIFVVCMAFGGILLNIKLKKKVP